jgi:glutamyl-tRNA synthetase
VLSASMNALELVEESNWNAAEIQAALQAALIDGLGLKPRVAYGPLRIAASGRKVSPPLFESLELLGKAESIARIDRLSGRLA